MRNTLIIILLFSIWACKEDEKTLVEIPKGGKVLLINEGNFQWGNSSLGFWSEEDNQYHKQAFKAANGIPLGDVFNSMNLINGEYWCVLNNSGLIHVIDTANFKILHTIKGFTSPRYTCDAGDNKVYVSDLYANGVWEVSSESYSITTKIALKGWTELMLMAGNKLWVTSSERPYVYLIEPSTNQIEDSIKIGNLANSILRFDNATVLILCEGKLGSSELAQLFQIDPKARQVTSKYDFKQGEKPRFLRKSPLTGDLYFIQNGLYKLDNQTFSVQEKQLELPSSIYGFDISKSGDMYISNGHDFVKNSTISVYTELKLEKQLEFDAGVNTNGFYFP